MGKNLKVFEAIYDQSFPCGGYLLGRGIVVANTELEALGVCLQNNPGTVAKFWELCEVDTTKLHESVHFESR